MNEDILIMEYRGENSLNYGTFFYDYPEFSGGQKNYDAVAVSGRMGEVVGDDLYKSNLKISCNFSILHKAFMPNVRELKKWLSGSGTLRFSDSSEVFYKVQKIDYESIERELQHYGRFKVIFTCTPYEYTDDGQIPVDSVEFNPYSESRPIYKISGNGSCTLTVNGKSIKATVVEELTIDTEKMMVYRDDGTIQNTAVSGAYEDLYLLPGENQISLTKGFQLSIIPNWGYEV